MNEKLESDGSFASDFKNKNTQKMKKTILTFGLISGGLLGLMMAIGVALTKNVGFENGMLIGYSTMVLAGIIMFVGVKQYRDNHAGLITFGKALKMALLITLISTLMYVAVWMVLSYTIMSNFMEEYATAMIDKARADGATAEKLEAVRVEMEGFKEMYKNPLIRAGMTFMEPLPIGVPLSFITAFILRKKQK